MKRVIMYVVFAIVLAITTQSCQTGFSKGTYISSLESFVNSVEQDYAQYDETDWQRSDEKMEAFKEKYDMYADKFTSEERRLVSKLMTKYEVIHSKAKMSGFFDGVDDLIDQGMGTIEGVLEGIKGNTSEE